MDGKERDRQRPELFAEKAALGEANEAQLARLGTPAEREERLRALRESNAEILARYPAGPAAAEITRQVAARRSRRSRRPLSGWLSAMALVTSTVMVVIFIGRMSMEVAPGPVPAGSKLAPPVGERMKGLEPHLVVLRQEGGGAAELSDGATGRPGDLLQLGYVPAGQRFGVLLSIDGRGGVTLHFPTRVGDSTALAAGGRTLLPASFQLDDAPSFERFFFITAADRELPVAELVEAARRLAAQPERARREPLPTAPALRQQSLLVRKTFKE